MERLIWAVEQLQGKVDKAQLSKIAELIIQAMTGPWRYFHTPEHIFEVGESGDAIEVLAALFHDLVYVQVDQGISINISKYIAAFVKETRQQLMIREKDELPEDALFFLVCHLFGMEPGQPLSPMGGQNEFLSAIIAAKSLEPFLATSTLMEIAACIEATVPFRPRLPSGETVNERLYRRMVELNDRLGFQWSEAHIEESIKRSVRVANRDVENFASPYAAHFLDNTWNLIPETNHALSGDNSYTVRGYRSSIEKMEGFMNFLKPELVFQQFRGEPDGETLAQLGERTRQNIEIARLYLGAKLLSIAVLEALSLRLGGNIPLSTMMGEFPMPGFPVYQLENFLPELPPDCSGPQTEIEAEVLNLLENGRSQDSRYDIKNSPVSTYFVKAIGFSEIYRLLAEAKGFFKGTVDAETFLTSCNPMVIENITEGVLQLFECRKSAISRTIP
ncbi:MAG: hypothetical protein SFW36_18755 [Leptolyngbyaceae cyanobacterium bins.59]|nr:hypothetical protein [Leptolyngbyaceae cyanobacterium bins.59]